MHLLRTNRGKNAQALLTAPKPESRPSMMIPTNTSLESVIVVIVAVARDSGSGTCESKNKHKATGAPTMIALVAIERFRDLSLL